MLNRRAIVLGLLLPTTIGCAPVITERLQGLTAGSVGCPPAEIVVSNLDDKTSFNPRAWQAECRGRTFQCTNAGTVSCTPMLPLAAAGTEAADAASPQAGISAADRDGACKAAQDYDRRATDATEPAKSQLQKMAETKHKECAGDPAR